MAISVQLDSNSQTLLFTDFPIAPIMYREAPAEEKLEQLLVVDKETGTTSSVFVEGEDLRNHGISLSTWQALSKKPAVLPRALQLISRIHNCLLAALPELPEYLKPQHRLFFENIPLANRIIQVALSSGNRHYRYAGVPGIYFISENGSLKHIFINLKKTPYLGLGSNAKVRAVFSLFDSKIVAKKVFAGDLKRSMSNVRFEMESLRNFQGKTGIISPIAGGCFEDKCALFMPLYNKGSLHTDLRRKPNALSQGEIKSIVLQWLTGLATIAEKGVHGDIKPLNLLIGEGEQGIEAVIADFGAYCPYEKLEWGLSTLYSAPPEYHENRKMVSSKGDVWSMGLCLLGIFSKERPPFVPLTDEELDSWISAIPTLPPDWSAAYPVTEGIPAFIEPLIREMLDIDPDKRPTAKEVLERFVAGYADFGDGETSPKGLSNNKF
jgi:hypothetical protein